MTILNKKKSQGFALLGLNRKSLVFKIVILTMADKHNKRQRQETDPQLHVNLILYSQKHTFIHISH